MEPSPVELHPGFSNREEYEGLSIKPGEDRLISALNAVIRLGITYWLITRQSKQPLYERGVYETKRTCLPTV
jgi:hypothetical protein